MKYNTTTYLQSPTWTDYTVYLNRTDWGSCLTPSKNELTYGRIVDVRILFSFPIINPYDDELMF